MNFKSPVLNSKTLINLIRTWFKLYVFLTHIYKCRNKTFVKSLNFYIAILFQNSWKGIKNAGSVVFNICFGLYLKNKVHKFNFTISGYEQFYVNIYQLSMSIKVFPSRRNIYLCKNFMRHNFYFISIPRENVRKLKVF